MLKAFARERLPESVYVGTRRAYHRVLNSIQLRQAKRSLALAPNEPEWLAPAELERLQGDYPTRRGEYAYDAVSLERRGSERADELAGLVPASARDFLEIGAHDAMTGAVLCERGRRVTAVDLEDARDERAQQVSSVEADAAELPLPDGSFDVVFSYNTFEHIAEPEAALSEAHRVLRPGGFLYLSFGPLYFSPFGLHAYYSIGVPYCQLLWPLDVLTEFIARHDRPPLKDYVNGWSAERWRELWQTSGDRLERVAYVERRDLTGLALICSFPSCFNAKTRSMDNLIVSTIEVLFRKR